MNEQLSDPFTTRMDIPDEVIESRKVLTSRTLADRYGESPSWRRIVEEPLDENEFFKNLNVLDGVQRAGIVVPPYTATVERWDDGVQNCILYVGHVDGKNFTELETVPENDYEDLGVKLLNYLETCCDADLPFLSDITDIHQYIYGKVSPNKEPTPILVDLELHTTGKHGLSDEIQWFIDDFLAPLEHKSSKVNEALRNRIISLASKYSINFQFPRLEE